MSLFVLDASVAVAWLLGEETESKAEMALRRLEDDEALVPHLWHLELRNCLLVATRRGRFTADGPTERLNALRDLPVRTDTEPDLTLAFVLAERHGLSFYDAVYLELAKRRYCQVNEKLVDRPPRYWARASREPAMLGIKNGRRPQLDNTHQPTVDYVARRTAGGRTRREIIRCLKRFLAREIYQRVMADFRMRRHVTQAA